MGDYKAPQPIATVDPLAASWTDLALNRPGASLRALAAAELHAMRRRSRVGAFVARLFDDRTQERAWRVGAEGEEFVGGRLERLNRLGWRVLHSVPGGRADSDIDHVLIGPPGVFTINTKHHPGARLWIADRCVMVNGQKHPYLRNSRNEATRAARLLSAAVGSVKQRPADVIVADSGAIPRSFERGTNYLDPSAVEAIYEAARRSTTWH